MEKGTPDRTSSVQTLAALALILLSVAGCARTPAEPSPNSYRAPGGAVTKFECQTYFGRAMARTDVAPRAQQLGPTRSLLKMVDLADLYFAAPLVAQGVVGERGGFSPAGHERRSVRVVSVVRNATHRDVRDGATIDVDLPTHAARRDAVLTLFLTPETSGGTGPFGLVAEPVSLWYFDGVRLGTAYASRSVKTLRVGNGYYVKHICSRPLFSVRQAKNEGDLERSLMRRFGVESRAQRTYYRSLLRKQSAFALLEWAVLHDRHGGDRFPTHGSLTYR